MLCDQMIYSVSILLGSLRDQNENEWTALRHLHLSCVQSIRRRALLDVHLSTLQSDRWDALPKLRLSTLWTTRRTALC